MHIKRPLSKAAIAATLGAPFAGFATAPVRDADAPIFRFGVVTDPQYASLPSWRTRHYANSLPKLTEAIGAFNREDLEFVVTLGDLIERDWDSYHPILPLYDDLRHPRFFVPGNHDYAVGDDDFGARLRENGAGRGYYDFSGGGYRFIVVDGG
jgi:hypothetical protein